MHGLGLSRRRFWIGAAGAVVVGLVGCGGSDRPKTIPINGVVTIDGKPPGESGQLYFTPISAAEGYSRRPASGAFNSAGQYRVMSWVADDGLVPGHYTVSVVPIDRGKTAIPTKYFQTSTSGVELDVPVDKSKIEFNIDVKTR